MSITWALISHALALGCSKLFLFCLYNLLTACGTDAPYRGLNSLSSYQLNISFRVFYTLQSLKRCFIW